VIFFALAGFGFGGFAVAAGCAHGILPFHSPRRMLQSLDLRRLHPVGCP
jgi:hypothetical protein